MPWWLYLEINWKDIWKPIRVDILNWCDTYYLHVDDTPIMYLNIGQVIKIYKATTCLYKNISKGQYHLIDFV